MYQDLIKALYCERCYLEKEAGKKYKITNGRRISSPPSSYGYVYSFVMEEEVFIADDVPVRLSLPERSADGEAVYSEGLLLIVQVAEDLGMEIPDAEIQAEAWKLLDAQYKKLQEKEM